MLIDFSDRILTLLTFASTNIDLPEGNYLNLVKSVYFTFAIRNILRSTCNKETVFEQTYINKYINNILHLPKAFKCFLLFSRERNTVHFKAHSKSDRWGFDVHEFDRTAVPENPKSAFLFLKMFIFDKIFIYGPHGTGMWVFTLWYAHHIEWNC